MQRKALIGLVMTALLLATLACGGPLGPALSSDPSFDGTTRSNPVRLGHGLVFEDFGTLRVIETQWQPGEAGRAIVRVGFTCDRPRDEMCHTWHLLLTVVGDSGTAYDRVLGTAGVPRPRFGDVLSPGLYGGGREEGYAGFDITKPETGLVLRVRKSAIGTYYYLALTR